MAIRSIGTELLPDVQRYITLATLGQRTPQEISEQISKRFDVAQRKADTIVRTEIKRQQNRGSEMMIQRTIPQAQEIGLRMERLWIHSSGRQDEGSAKGKHRVRYEPRPHHKAMHGVGVDASMKFTLRNAETGETWFVDGPHDTALPAGEVVNCYCDRVLRISRESIALLNEERVKADRLRRERSVSV